jgi:hypothetical protein
MIFYILEKNDVKVPSISNQQKYLKKDISVSAAVFTYFNFVWYKSSGYSFSRIVLFPVL